MQFLRKIAPKSFSLHNFWGACQVSRRSGVLKGGGGGVHEAQNSPVQLASVRVIPVEHLFVHTWAVVCGKYELWQKSSPLQQVNSLIFDLSFIYIESRFNAIKIVENKLVTVKAKLNFF